MARSPEIAIVINGKRKVLTNRIEAQLEHLLQQAEDQLQQYKDQIKNYPPARMERCGKPFLNVLENNVAKIKLQLEIKQFPSGLH